MRNILFRLAVLTLAVWVADYLVDGLGCDRWRSLLVAGLVLAILNALVKPVLVFFSFPLVLFTLGGFLILINALLFYLTFKIVPGLHIQGFLPAVWGSLVVSGISLFFGLGRKASGKPQVRLHKTGPPGPKSPRSEEVEPIDI